MQNNKPKYDDHVNFLAPILEKLESSHMEIFAGLEGYEDEIPDYLYNYFYELSNRYNEGKSLMDEHDYINVIVYNLFIRIKIRRMASAYESKKTRKRNKSDSF